MTDEKLAIQYVVSRYPRFCTSIAGSSCEMVAPSSETISSNFGGNMGSSPPLSSPVVDDISVAQQGNTRKRRRGMGKNRQRKLSRVQVAQHQLNQVLMEPDDNRVMCSTGVTFSVKNVKQLLTSGSFISDDMVYNLLKIVCTGKAEVVDPLLTTTGASAQSALNTFKMSRMLVMPLYHLNHWTVLILQGQSSVHYFDSLYPSQESPYSLHAQQILLSMRDVFEKDLSFSNEICSQQDTDENSCGLHVVENAERYISSIPMLHNRVLNRERERFAMRLLYGSNRIPQDDEVQFQVSPDVAKNDDIVML